MLLLALSAVRGLTPAGCLEYLRSDAQYKRVDRQSRPGTRYMSIEHRLIAPSLFGSAADGSGVCVRIVRYQALRHMATHAHESASITLVIRGGFEEESAAGSIRAGVGDCVIKPVGVPHADQFSESKTTTLQIKIGGPARTAQGRDSIKLGAYRCGGNSKLASVLFELFAAVTQSAEEPGHRAIDNLVIDALGLAASESQRMPATRPSWLRRVEAEILRTLPDAIRVADLAELAGVHPVHMARVFQRVHGCGVVQYMRRLRVQHAADALARGGVNLCDAALRAGFYDQPHLNRAFRRQIGLSPARYRRLAEGAADWTHGAIF